MLHGHVLGRIEEYVEFEEETQLRIPKKEWPAGCALKWVTESVWGQPFPQVRARSEKGGWVPVHQEDFDGMYRGRFMPADFNGEIKVDGLVLMARPQIWSDKADNINRRRAEQRVQIKEMQLRMGDLGGVTLAADHPTPGRSHLVDTTVG